jgi:hypothetical protein
MRAAEVHLIASTCNSRIEILLLQTTTLSRRMLLFATMHDTGLEKIGQAGVSASPKMRITSLVSLTVGP